MLDSSPLLSTPPVSLPFLLPSPARAASSLSPWPSLPCCAGSRTGTSSRRSPASQVHSNGQFSHQSWPSRLRRLPGSPLPAERSRRTSKVLPAVRVSGVGFQLTPEPLSPSHLKGPPGGVEEHAGARCVQLLGVQREHIDSKVKGPGGGGDLSGEGDGWRGGRWVQEWEVGGEGGEADNGADLQPLWNPRRGEETARTPQTPHKTPHPLSPPHYIPAGA